MINDLAFLDDLVAPIRSHVASGCALTIGNFDGVHIGHRSIIQALRADAKELGVPAVALTFEPHPATVFRSRPPADYRISTSSERAELLRSSGIEHVVTAEFSDAFAGLTANEFVDTLLLARLHVRAVHVGYDFNYGKGRAGSRATLQSRLAPHGITTTVHQAVESNGVVASSTEVRRLIREGHLATLNRMLQRPFTLAGRTAPGAARGRKMGVPTVNLYPTDRLLPKFGVYATRVTLGDTVFDAVSNIGVRPTFPDDDRVSLESFLFGDPGDLPAGTPTSVALIGFIRPERKFANADVLSAQIGEDVGDAQKLLAAYEGGSGDGDQ
jgi:riboflavin kinase/FMN adenylyltransferase